MYQLKLTKFLWFDLQKCVDGSLFWEVGVLVEAPVDVHDPIGYGLEEMSLDDGEFN